MFKSFKLGFKPYRIVNVKHDTNNLGEARSPLCQIKIQKIWSGQEIPEISREQTAFHEVTHCILDEIGRNDLNSDEMFVQSFSLLMHQFFRTMK